MADDEDPAEEITYFLGIPVTAAGKARARRQLDEARARMAPEMWAALRARFGYRPNRLAVPGLVARRYSESMAEEADVRTDMTAMLAAAGITVTPEGRERARRQLAEARARRTPERLNEMRALVGLPPIAA